MKSTGIAYVLWAFIFLGLGGLHRLYSGKIFTGLIWLFTFGLFGIGQFIDLFLIPEMVEYANIKWKLLHQPTPHQVILNINPPQAKDLIQPEIKSIGYQIFPPELRQKTTLSSSRSPSILEKLFYLFSKDSSKNMMQQLLSLARTKGGAISVTDGVLATGRSFEEVEKVLNKMLKSGYVDIDNDPESGVVIYKFREMV